MKNISLTEEQYDSLADLLCLALMVIHNSNNESERKDRMIGVYNLIASIAEDERILSDDRFDSMEHEFFYPCLRTFFNNNGAQEAERVIVDNTMAVQAELYEPDLEQPTHAI